MARRLSFVCDDEVADRIEALAREHGVSEEEVLRQVIRTGLDEIESRRI